MDKEQGAAGRNLQQATHTLSLVTSQEGGGSSDGRGATSVSLFDAREVEPGAGDKVRVARARGPHDTPCSSSRAKRGQGGGDGDGDGDGRVLVCRGERPTSDSLFYAREMGWGC